MPKKNENQIYTGFHLLMGAAQLFPCFLLKNKDGSKTEFTKVFRLSTLFIAKDAGR